MPPRRSFCTETSGNARKKLHSAPSQRTVIIAKHEADAWLAELASKFGWSKSTIHDTIVRFSLHQTTSHYFFTRLTALSLGVLPIRPPPSSGAQVALVSLLPSWYSYAQFRELYCLLHCSQRSHIRWCNVPFFEWYWHVIVLRRRCYICAGNRDS
jgi:hypothetical protein